MTICAQNVLAETKNSSQTIDDRASFYALFCVRLKADGDASCDRYIYPPQHVSSKPKSNSAESLDRTRKTPVTIVFVPGLFGQCVESLATPYSDAYAELRKRGATVVVGRTEGRSSSERNAELLDQQLSLEISPADAVILVGYSKGTTDLLVALLANPKHQWVQNTFALVSVDGVVQGTPLAEEYLPLYQKLQKIFDPAFCPEGDGGAIESMTYRDRKAWLQSHTLPQHIRYYSIASIGQEGKINPLLLPFYLSLTKNNPRNDGQMIVDDSLLPASHLLAVLKSDHWAMALPFEASSDIRARALSVHNHFPRGSTPLTRTLQKASS